MGVVIPAEPTGSIPRASAPIAALSAAGHADPDLDVLREAATRGPVEHMAAAGSTVSTDGKQRKFGNSGAYFVDSRPSTPADGLIIAVAAAYSRRKPRITATRFRHTRYENNLLTSAKRWTRLAVEQAVISSSALSPTCHAEGISRYARNEFIHDLVSEPETESRCCLQPGIHTVQIDSVEARVARKIDPSCALLHNFVDLNNIAIERFLNAEPRHIGVHTWLSGNRGSTQSADVDDLQLLPSLVELRVGSFHVALSSEQDKTRVREFIGRNITPPQRVLIGVIRPIDSPIETPAVASERAFEAAPCIAADQPGITHDCGFAQFATMYLLPGNPHSRKSGHV